MTRKPSPYKTYTIGYKAEAVRLMQASDRPASEIAPSCLFNLMTGVRDEIKSRTDRAAFH